MGVRRDDPVRACDSGRCRRPVRAETTGSLPEQGHQTSCTVLATARYLSGQKTLRGIAVQKLGIVGSGGSGSIAMRVCFG